ncbi:MAG: HAD hydrolase family protein [Candidatus Omnitrophica bacterium]|jgi:3-deoxy-D-manno-octulosonate 8-phosphate phosphatase (KDO 8-P phosphatase)|nr:HAD hydrolase family protein [Candidatus Omnitrophota bacterium]
MTAQDLNERLKRIRLIATDLDGVLTNGTIYYGDHGDEIKGFNIQDGQGMVLAQRAKIRTVIITGRKSRVNERRAKDLRVDRLIQNCHEKGKVLEKLVHKYGLELEQAAYVGDDILDLAPMRKAGLAVAVQNAVGEVKQAAHYVTERRGGDGAVREVIDMILKAQDLWSGITAKVGS